MSYAATVIVVYGVELTPDQTEKLRVSLKYDDDSVCPEGEIAIVPFDKLTVYDSIPVKSSPSFVDGIQLHFDYHYRKEPRHIHDAGCYSHDTDGHIHDLTFEKGRTHTFGICCGSKGYAYSDKIEDIIANIPKRAKENFRDYCAPILKGIGITTEPSIRLVNQVW
jgi:hypothetical protein